MEEMKLFTLIRDSFRQESAVITWAQTCMKGGGGGDHGKK